MQEIVRKALGIIVSVLLASLSTYFIINTFHTIPGGILTMLGIVSVSGFVGGLVSKDRKAGFLSGLLAGISAPLNYAQNFQIGALHLLVFRFVLFGLLAGVVGIAGTWIENRFIGKDREQKPIT